MSIKQFTFATMGFESAGKTKERFESLNTDIRSALRMEPLKPIATRAIVVELSKMHKHGFQATLDTIGMRYDIDPAFYRAFFLLLVGMRRNRETLDGYYCSGTLGF